MVVQMSESKGSPEETVQQWTRFWNSYDLNQVDALFEHAVTYYSSEKEGLLVGIGAVRDHHKVVFLALACLILFAQGFGFLPGGNPEKQGNKLSLEGTRLDNVGSAVRVRCALFCVHRAAFVSGRCCRVDGDLAVPSQRRHNSAAWSAVRCAGAIGQRRTDRVAHCTHELLQLQTRAGRRCTGFGFQLGVNLIDRELIVIRCAARRRRECVRDCYRD